MVKKRIFFGSLVLIAAMAALSLVGISSGEAAYKPGERAMKIWQDDLNPSKKALFLKFKASADTGDGKEESITTMAVKGNFMYVDILSETTHMSTITDNAAKTTTILMHEEKMYMKMPHQSFDGPTLNDDKDLSEAEKTKLVVSSGKDKIAGRTYDYDKIKVSEGEEQIYYFDEGTNKWRYWKTSEALMEIIEYGSKVDENLFKIPKGYTKMEI